MGACALGARIPRAGHAIAAVAGRAAGAARRRGFVSRSAARIALGTQRRVAAFAGGTSVLGARVAVATLRVFTAFRATAARTAHRVAAAARRSVITQLRGGAARVVGARVAIVTGGRVGAGLFRTTAVGHRTILAGLAFGVVRRMRARTGKTHVVRTAQAVLAVCLVTAFAAGTGATLLGRAAFRSDCTRAVGPTLIDRARIAVVAIFRALAGNFRRGARICIHGHTATASHSDRPRASSTIRGELSPAAGISRQRTEREQDAHT